MKNVSRNLTNILTLLTLGMIMSAEVQASSKVWLGLNNSDLSVSPTDTATGGTGLSLGAAYEIGISPIGIEIGFAYNGLKFVSNSTTVSTSFLSIPVLVRYSFVEILNLGAGLYYNFGVGEPSTEPAAAGVTFSSLNLKSSDLGLVFAFGGALPLGVIDLLLDVRYSFSLSNVSTAAAPTEAKWTNLQILAGVAF